MIINDHNFPLTTALTPNTGTLIGRGACEIDDTLSSKLFVYNLNNTDTSIYYKGALSSLIKLKQTY